MIRYDDEHINLLNNSVIEKAAAIVIELNELAMGYKTRKEYDKAVEKLNKAIVLEPQNPIPYHTLGMVYSDKKEYNSAIAAYRKALEISPNSVSTINNLGFMYHCCSQVDVAIEYYKKAYLLNPEYASVILNLGLAYKNKNMLAESMNYYKKLLNLKFDYQNAYTIENSISEDIKYLILKDRSLSRVYNTDEFARIKTAIIYFYEDDFNQNAHDNFVNGLNSQINKNYAVFAVNNNFCEILTEIENQNFTHICFVEQNDLIHNNALASIAETFALNDDIDLIYTDEDLLNKDGSTTNPYFKTEYAEFLLLSHNYMNALLCLKLNDKTLEELKNSKTVNQAFLYKLVLKLMQKEVRAHRIPEVLYHRDTENFAKLERTSTKEIIEQELKDRNYNAEIVDNDNKYYNIIRFLPDKSPKISIIIPFKDKIYLLKNCISSIEQKSTYKNYEIILVNNQSTDADALEYFNNSKHKKINADFPFNYARINNIAVEQAEGEYLLFLNNDIEVIAPDWMESLLGLAQLDKVGIVGAKLIYSNTLIQHAGVVKLGNRRILHINRGARSDSGGYKNYKNLIREYLAVTGACIMTSKEKFKKTGCFDENLAVELNDIDLNFKFIEAGYINLYDGNCVLYHHESISRKGLFRDTVSKEFDYFYKKWDRIISKPDPYYNPNLSDSIMDFSIKFVHF